MKFDTKSLIDSFQKLNVLVVGDVMLDTYLEGDVERISPEAPVPVVSVNKRERRLGGAANVAVNLKAAGANTFLASVVGNDEEGHVLQVLMEKWQINAEGLVFSPERPTTEKTRIMCRNQQMLRYDREVTTDLSRKDSRELIEAVEALVKDYDINIIILQDYDKGVLTRGVINSILTLAEDHNILTAVDPKRKHFFDYTGVTLFKPNLKEVKEGLHLIHLDASEKGQLENAAVKLKDKIRNDITLITLSDKGMFAARDGESLTLDAHLRNIADVSGAGDTVIAIASLSLAAGATLYEMAELSNIAGGLVCEYPGVVPVNKEQLIAEAARLMG